MEKILYFDVETTGTDPNRHGLIQLGQIIEVDGEVVMRKSWDIQPFRNDQIEDAALNVTKTDKATLFDNAVRLPPEAAWFEMRASWNQVIDKYDQADKFILAGYNVDSFDQNFLREFIRKNTPTERFSVAGSYLGHLTIDPLPYLKWLKALGQLNIENLKLQTVCDKLGIVLVDAHDAMADIEATRWLIHRIRRQLQAFHQLASQVDDMLLSGQEDVDPDSFDIINSLTEPVDAEQTAQLERQPMRHQYDDLTQPDRPDSQEAQGDEHSATPEETGGTGPEHTATKDMKLDMAIHQGYVPKTCTQKGGYVIGAVNVGHDPCQICREDRSVCLGRHGGGRETPETDTAGKGGN